MSAPISALVFSDENAFKLSFSIYVHAGSLSIMLWDIMHNLKNDYHLIFTHDVKMPTVVYFISRIVTLGFVLGKTIFLTVPMNDCSILESILVAFYNIFAAATMLLSYIRVCAVFDQNFFVVVGFGISWLIAVGGSLTVITGMTGRHIPGSQFCIDEINGQYIAAAFIGLLLNHILVLLAITYGLTRLNTENREALSIQDKYRKFVLGKSLPAFSRELLKDTQFCYLMATISNIFAVVWFFALSRFESSSAFRLTGVVVYCVTVNIMLCRVYRNTKLRNAYNKPSLLSPQHVMGPSRMSSANQLSARAGGGGKEGGDPQDLVHYVAGDESDMLGDASSPMPIQVKQVVEYQMDYPRDRDAHSPDRLESISSQSGDAFTVKMV